MKLFLIFLISGFLINQIFPFFRNYINFSEGAIILLVMGLYASVYEIDIKIFKKHKHLLLSAVTIGVLLKSIIIGFLFFVITKSFMHFCLGWQ